MRYVFATLALLALLTLATMLDSVIWRERNPIKASYLIPSSLLELAAVDINNDGTVSKSSVRRGEDAIIGVGLAGETLQQQLAKPYNQFEQSLYTPINLALFDANQDGVLNAVDDTFGALEFIYYDPNTHRTYRQPLRLSPIQSLRLRHNSFSHQAVLHADRQQYRLVKELP